MRDVYCIENSGNNFILKDLQQCSKRGVKLVGASYLIRNLDMELGKRTKLVVLSLGRREEVIKMIRYLLIHAQFTNRVIQSSLLRAHLRKDYKMVMHYEDFLGTNLVNETKNIFKTAHKLDMSLQHSHILRSKIMIKRFLSKHRAPRMLKDNLLYKPPKGLMIKRGMRECGIE